MDGNADEFPPTSTPNPPHTHTEGNLPSEKCESDRFSSRLVGEENDGFLRLHKCGERDPSESSTGNVFKTNTPMKD